MSEPTFGTEDTGFGPAEQAPAPVSAPAGGFQFTPEQLAAARQQLLDQGELDPAAKGGPDVAEDSATLGMKALADGAQSSEVDTGELLRQIQAMQSRMDTLEREKRMSTAPEVVKYATALHDHLTAKAAAHPAIAADPDHNWGQVLEQTASIKEAAATAAESGKPGTLKDDLGKVAAWVSRHAKRFPQIDYSYVLELAEDAAGALARLGI